MRITTDADREQRASVSTERNERTPTSAEWDVRSPLVTSFYILTMPDGTPIAFPMNELIVFDGGVEYQQDTERFTREIPTDAE